MAEEEDPRSYRWETEYEKTWEAIQENEEGLLQPSVEDIVFRAKRRRLLDKRHIRLGMMRHLYVVVDFSEAMKGQDLKPTRHLCTLKVLEGFVEEFFDQNPISQLGFILTRNKRAEKLTELGGNPKRHLTALAGTADFACSGEPSLQNALELAAQILKHMPGHTSREILIILGSLTTCDPGDIHSTIELMKTHSIRCSVIGLAAELHVCKVLTKVTDGTYDIILDEHHYRELIYQHVLPPPASASTESSLIRMGFPRHQSEGEGKPSMCMCHLDSKTGEGFGTGGFYCPQCSSKYCELPVECKACGLTLVSAAHLARSYHHLFPLDRFEEIPATSLQDMDAKLCRACQAPFKEQMVYQCGKCHQLFCLECDLFIHDTLHVCPGCGSTQQPLPSIPSIN